MTAPKQAETTRENFPVVQRPPKSGINSKI